MCILLWCFPDFIRFYMHVFEDLKVSVRVTSWMYVYKYISIPSLQTLTFRKAFYYNHFCIWIYSIKRFTLPNMKKYFPDNPKTRIFVIVVFVRVTPCNDIYTRFTLLYYKYCAITRINLLYTFFIFQKET